MNITSGNPRVILSRVEGCKRVLCPLELFAEKGRVRVVKMQLSNARARVIL